MDTNGTETAWVHPARQSARWTTCETFRRRANSSSNARGDREPLRREGTNTSPNRAEELVLVPIAFDTSHPIDTEDRRIALVRAIVAAGDRDGERHWIEWKSKVEVASQEAETTLVKEILAMANRDRARALTHCGGWGYIVVGATEEGIVGAERQKTGAWEQQLGKYLGEGGLSDFRCNWPLASLVVRGVDAPLEGDGEGVECSLPSDDPSCPTGAGRVE